MLIYFSFFFFFQSIQCRLKTGNIGATQSSYPIFPCIRSIRYYLSNFFMGIVSFFLTLLILFFVEFIVFFFIFFPPKEIFSSFHQGRQGVELGPKALRDFGLITSLQNLGKYKYCCIVNPPNNSI